MIRQFVRGTYTVQTVLYKCKFHFSFNSDIQIFQGNVGIFVL